MLGVKDYSQEYIKDCRARVDQQLATYQTLLASVTKQASQGDELKSAVESFEANFFNNLVMLLDWLFVHRLRTLEGKDGNPLNEVRVICDSLVNNQGKLIKDKQIKLDPKTSILGYEVGDEIRLNEADFVRLADGFFAEIESKFMLANQAEIITS